MTTRTSFTLKLIAAAGFFLLMQWLVGVLALSCFNKAEIDARLDHADSVQLFPAATLHFQEALAVSTKDFPAKNRTVQPVDLKNRVMRTLRIDPGHLPGSVALYGIRLLSFFGPPVFLPPEQIKDLCSPNADISSMQVIDDHVAIVVTGTDPQLTCRTMPRVNNPAIRWFLPLIYSLVFLLLLTKVSIRAFPAFSGITSKTATMGANIDALDGIRGFAALTVLAEHTGVFKGTGYFGVLLFFILSGFLLSAPFIQRPERAVSLQYMSGYLFRRLKRILPMFYVTVTILFLFRGKAAEAFRHFFFLQADSILWTVMQEMVFYLILPVLMAVIYLLFRGKRGYAILFLLAVVVAADHLLTTEVLALYSEGTLLRAQIGVFTTGVLFAYTFYLLAAIPAFQRLRQGPMRKIFSALGLLLFAAMIALAMKLVPTMHLWTPYTKPGIFGFLSGLFLLLVVLAPKTWLSRILGWYPLRAVGLVSFSFYLLHPLVIATVKTAALEFFAIPSYSGYGMFLLSGVITYGLSICTYTYIERPFIRGASQ